MDVSVHRAWRRDPALLDAVRAVFTYGPGEDRATGYLYGAGEQAWPAPLAELGPQVLGELLDAGCPDFTIVAYQAYLNGSGCGWHTDTAFDAQAILSLGITRTFGLRRHDGDPTWIRVHHGDLLVMPSGFQDEWEHCVPTEDASGERISLVFRTVARR